MKILITNDDGIDAPGLEVLLSIARDVAGPDGQVITVAPAFEQSGVGHCISYTKPMRLLRLEDDRFAVEGSPADCVLAGLGEIMRETPPDLILSGVNRGNNAAQNTLYSGTIGATIEAAMHGIKSIALSQFMGPNSPQDDIFQSAREHGADTVRRIWENAPWGDGPYDLFYNVNFPPCAAKDVKGPCAVAQGFRENTLFTAVLDEDGHNMRIQGGLQQTSTEPGTDVAANLDGFISVTPMRCDLTAKSALDPLAKALDK